MTGTTSTEPAPPAPTLARRSIRAEVWLVFALSLGASGIRAALDIIRDLTTTKVPLKAQVTVLNGSQAQQSWLDLTLQLMSIATAMVPVFLVMYFLSIAGDSLRTLGMDWSRPAADAIRGAALAALIGGSGLALYLVAQAHGGNLIVVPENLPAVWWRIPVLLLSAIQNAVVEEVLVAGYLLHQLKKLGWGDYRALLVSALVRGSYHLYQGIGAFVGNFVMGLIFGRMYQRFGRTAPLVIAHALIDAVAFIGYIALAGHVSWLPVPGR